MALRDEAGAGYVVIGPSTLNWWRISVTCCRANTAVAPATSRASTATMRDTSDMAATMIALERVWRFLSFRMLKLGTSCQSLSRWRTERARRRSVSSTVAKYHQNSQSRKIGG